MYSLENMFLTIVMIGIEFMKKNLPKKKKRNKLVTNLALEWGNVFSSLNFFFTQNKNYSATCVCGVQIRKAYKIKSFVSMTIVNGSRELEGIQETLIFQYCIFNSKSLNFTLVNLFPLILFDKMTRRELDNIEIWNLKSENWNLSNGVWSC